MKNLWCGLILLFTATAAAQTVCLHDKRGRLVNDQIRASHVFNVRKLPVQLKTWRGKTVLPLAAGYADTHPFYWRDKPCFQAWTWLYNLREQRFDAVDDTGKYLGYQPVISTDGTILDEPSEGYMLVQLGGKYGFADAKTGKLRIRPQFYYAHHFQNGRAKVTLKGIERSLSSSDSMPVFFSDEWFYIDKQGKRLPQTPPQDDLDAARKSHFDPY